MDYDTVVIGSGPGGYVAAIRCAQLGLKTACVEKDPALGGTCLNVGCIPSKSLLQSSEFYHKAQHEAKEHGIDIDAMKLNFTQMMSRKDGVVKGFNTGIKGLFQKNKVTAIQGHARFTSNTTIDVNGKSISSKNFIIATGSAPISLPFLPIDEKRIITSTGALALEAVPKKLLIIGAGIIGVELGSVYQRLGSEVQFIEFLDHICPSLDGAVSKAFQKILIKQGLKFQLSSKVTDAKVGDQIELTYEGPEGPGKASADVVLVAIGRKPYTEGLDLDKIDIEPDKRGFIPIDTNFRTAKPNIFAIGDIVEGPMLAHKASEEGIAVAELLAGQSPHIEYLTIPNVVYTSPEVAGVGLTEEQAKSMGLSLKVGQFPFKANSRARCVGEDEGFVKLIAEANTGIVIGGHIIGAHAGELIHEIAIAILKKTTAVEIADASHAHPTFSEAIKEAALALSKKAIHI